MKSIIITGHGEFATGLRSMLRLILGESEKTYFVNFTENMSSEDLKQKFQEIYEKENGNVLFLCDIAGGTPFNQASMIMHENNKDFSVIGGINIPLILEALDQREISNNGAEILNSAKHTGCANIKIFGEQIEESSNSDDDGI